MDHVSIQHFKTRRVKVTPDILKPIEGKMQKRRGERGVYIVQYYNSSKVLQMTAKRNVTSTVMSLYIK
jgi:hypothetical protein